MAKTRTSKKARKGRAGASRVARRKYTDAQRRAAVADVEALGLAKAVQRHGVPKSTLHAWTMSRAWKQPAVPSETEAPLRGRRFTAAQRQHALTLVASGMKRTEIAAAIGTTTESVRRWIKAAEAAGTMPTGPVVGGGHGNAGAKTKTSSPSSSSPPSSSPPSVYAPRDPGQGLSEAETAAILSYKKKHPSMGPAQIRAQLKRFKGWRVSVKAIARVLRQHGYEPVHRGSRPQGPEPVRFEAPRPNAMAGWPRAVAGPGLPQIRTCGTPASGSSGHGFAERSTEWIATGRGSGSRSRRRLNRSQVRRRVLRRPSQ